MTISKNEIKSFVKEFTAAEIAASTSVGSLRDQLGDAEQTFQLTVVDLGAKLSNKSPTPEECKALAIAVVEAKTSLPVGDPRHVTKKSANSVASKFKTLIQCGAANHKAELEAALPELMTRFAKYEKGPIDKKIQNVRQSLYSARCKNPTTGAAVEALWTRSVDSVEAKVKKDKAASKLSPVEFAAQQIATSIKRAVGNLKDADKPLFDNILAAVEKMAPAKAETKVEAAPVEAAPVEAVAPVVEEAKPAPALEDLASMMLKQQQDMASLIAKFTNK